MGDACAASMAHLMLITEHLVVRALEKSRVKKSHTRPNKKNIHDHHSGQIGCDSEVVCDSLVGAFL